ncbi:terminase gpP N-terminus-related DNA-binding protein [Metabacillus fastidiosus]
MIRDLYQKGWMKSVIAKETGFDYKTIHKYIKNDQLP